MENLIELLVWILVVFGAANGIAVATVLEPVRNFFYTPSQWDSEKEKWVETLESLLLTIGSLKNRKYKIKYFLFTKPN